MKVKDRYSKKSTINYLPQNHDRAVNFLQKPQEILKRRNITRDVTIHENKTVIKSRATFTILVSILLYIISFLGNNISGEFDIKNLSVDFIFSLLEDVASVVLGMGLGAMLLDFFSYVRYTQERIKEVMIDKKFLESVKDEEKKRMISTLESSLYFNDREIPADSLYANIREKITPLLEKEYVEEHFIHIDCHITDTYIEKVCTNRLTIISPHKDPKYSLPFQVYFKKDSEVPGKNSFQVEDLIVNKKSITVTNASPKVTPKGNVYLFSHSFTLNKGRNTIAYKTISYVKPNDNTYSHTVTLPCKHYTIEMYTDNQDYLISGNGFCIDKSEIMRKNDFVNGCRLDFNDWIIPGDGCLFAINKK